MNHDLRFTPEKIAKRITLIRPLIFKDKAPMYPFSLERLADPFAQPGSGEDCGVVEWDSYWAGQDTHFVLTSQFSVPEAFKNPALYLPLGASGDIFTHPEGLLHIDGSAVASADRYHHLIRIDHDLADGNQHDLLLKGWTGLTGWPVDPSNPTKLQIRQCFVVDVDIDLQEFVVLVEVALDVANTLPEGDRKADRILSALDAAFLALDTRDPLNEAFRASIKPATTMLKEKLGDIGGPDSEKLWAIGHAHMDIAYLWPISQIRQKNARTYSNVLRLMDAHEGFHFSHSQPQLYDYTKQDFPEIYDNIKARIAEGRWEAMGGMWVEPDCNMPGGEALVRQILLGRQFYKEEFGDVDTPVLWLPDTFGFPWSLPQLMKQSGLEFFVTNKLNWNQYNQMPSSTTWWQGIDGTKVLAQFLTTPREVQHLPFPTNYKSDLSAEEVLGTVTNATVGSDITDFMIAYGYGDGGGGPTDELVMRAKAFTDMPGAPEVQMGKVADAMDALKAQSGNLPVWNDEFYMEGHRGVLTSQAWIKRANRQAERALHDVEATLVVAFPQGASEEIRNTLRVLWQRVCLLQFHDVLTGTSIPIVFEEAREDYNWIMNESAALQTAAQQNLSNGDGLALFNPSSAASDSVIFVPQSSVGQKVDGGRLVAISPLPPYASQKLEEISPESSVHAQQTDRSVTIENGVLRVTIALNGDVTSVFHKPTNREALSQGEIGNQLWAYEDRPLSWDAWDIDVFHTDRAERIHNAESVEILEAGPLRSSVQICYTFKNSKITQTLRLKADCPRLDFETEVDWHEQHTLLKAAFPVDVLSPRATYEIQWGEIERTTHSNTSWDFAKFEVPAQKWASLSEGGFGVALLNDCKYGYSIRDNVMQLSLVKSSTNPDPRADQGLHYFTYSLLPHDGQLELVRAEARRLNNPVHVLVGTPVNAGAIVSCNRGNAILETLKPAEDGNGFILRLFESERRRGKITLNFEIPIERVDVCNLLEETLSELEVNNDKVELDLSPFEIVSLRCIPASSN